MRNIVIAIVIVICLLSCSSEKKSNNDMEGLIKKYAINSLNIQDMIGEDNYMLSYKIKNGKLLIAGMRNKERTSDNYTSLIFVIDIENKKLLSTIEDPVKDYVGLRYEMVDDSTLFFTHILTRNEIYLTNIFSHNIEKKYMKFDKSANRPGIIDANGKQLFMTGNVYGFAVADLDKLKGQVFDNSSFHTSQSVVSYPIDEKLNLLSGTFVNDSIYRDIITVYAINEKGDVKWTKTLPPIEYELGQSGAFSFFNFKNCFIVRYHNNVECWDKTDGKLIWNFVNEHPITEAYMVGNKLVMYSSNAEKVVLSDDEKENEKAKEKFYRENFVIIDLDNGKPIWNKSTNGITTSFGILNDDLLLINKKEKLLINISNGEEQNIESALQLSSDSAYFEQIMDTKTGKLYLKFNGVLYW